MAGNSQARVVWSHINGNGDLFCEIEKYVGRESSQPSLILKVVQHGRSLECLDLDQHFGGINNEPKSSQEDAIAKPAFPVVVKLPCIAIKYQLNNMQMRRVQIRFSQDYDYYTALSMLSSVNCPLAEGTMPGLHRPPSTVSGASVPTAQLTNNPAREMGTMVTPESNAPGPSNYMARAASGFETVASNAPSPSSTKVHHPVIVLQDQFTMQTLETENETALARSLLAIQAEPGQTTSQQAASRLSTGPIYHDQELNQMLPPKRNLPFTKLKSKMSRADTSSLKSSQQIVPESSYPEPDILKRRESVMSESQSQQLIQTQPYPETMEASQNSSQIQATLPYPGLNTKLQQQAPASSAAGSNKRPRTDGHINATDAQASQSATWSMPLSVEEQLSQYVKAPTKERSAFLESWMCELIQDDHFVTLCEDVERTWRRFAFGVKP